MYVYNNKIINNTMIIKYEKKIYFFREKIFLHALLTFHFSNESIKLRANRESIFHSEEHLR